MDTAVAVMKATAEIEGNASISITEEQVVVEKKGMGMNMNTVMDSAADSEMKYSHPVSVCRRLSNGSKKKKQNWKNT